LLHLPKLRPRVFSSRELPLTASTFSVDTAQGISLPSQVFSFQARLTSEAETVGFELLSQVLDLASVISFESLSISQDILLENRLLPADIFAGDLNLFGNDQQVQVSDNLFLPIDGPQKISGMNYSDRYWTSDTLLRATDGQRQVRRTRSPVRPKDITSETSAAMHEGQQVSVFWDRIFVLLQPPIELEVPDSLQLPYRLYPYQITGVKFLISNEHALLADDMGTGKTVMTTVALRILMQQNKVKRALILCPPSILYEWKRHLEEWAPELLTCFVRGTQFERSCLWSTPAHVYVTTYDTLRNDVEKYLIRQGRGHSFDLVVIDEAHHIKNPETKRAKAVGKLSPKYRWALTGTPIQNKIEDMVALFKFIHPNLLSSSFSLHEEYIKRKIEPHFLRRRKQDVLKDLPPKIKQDIWLEMSKQQRQEYERAEGIIQAELEALGENVTRQHIFSRMQTLKQICNFPSDSGTSPKLDMLKGQIEDIVESGHKLIVFSQYISQGIAKIAVGLKPYGVAVIVGGVSDARRRQEIERFRHSATTPILLASLKAAGEGLNLTEASYVVHFDHWWNPAVMWQAEDRVHRKGQQNSVNIYSYWMAETIEERIHRILQRKGLLIENVVDGLAERKMDELFTMDDLLEIIGMKKVAQKKPAFDPQQWAHLSLQQIQQKLLQVSPKEFEDLVARLIHYLGYPNVKVTKRSGDGGIDVLSTRFTDYGIERIAVQCKRYRTPVGVDVAREFLGAIQDDKSIVKGYLVTTSEFTRDCINYCQRHNIEMINGVRMAQYTKQFGLSA